MSLLNLCDLLRGQYSEPDNLYNANLMRGPVVIACSPYTLSSATLFSNGYARVPLISERAKTTLLESARLLFEGSNDDSRRFFGCSAFADIISSGGTPVLENNGKLSHISSPAARVRLRLCLNEFERIACDTAAKLNLSHLVSSAPFGVLRFCNYRPAAGTESTVGFGAHTDNALFTISLLLSSSEDSVKMGVEPRDGLSLVVGGKWVNETQLCSQNEAIVFPGDILEAISGGAIRAMRHRVDINTSSSRLSVAYIVRGSMESDVTLGGQTYPLSHVFRFLSLARRRTKHDNDSDDDTYVLEAFGGS